MTRRLTLHSCALAALYAGLTCAEPAKPVAGMLQLELTTPNPGQDGAMLLTITAPAAVATVATPPGSGLRVFFDTLGANVKVIVTGTLQTGPILEIGVPDVRQVALYAATVDQVARLDSSLRDTAFGYVIQVAQ